MPQQLGGRRRLPLAGAAAIAQAGLQRSFVQLLHRSAAAAVRWMGQESQWAVALTVFIGYT